MSLSNPNKPVTEQRLQEFYHEIEPYMGGSGGTGGGGHTIEDSEGTDLTQRDTMQFGDGFNASDDSENEKTVVEPNLMTAADMDDVVTPLPSVQSRYHKYSTEEQIVGEWIDGKPVYQKVFVQNGNLTNRTTYFATDFSELKVDKIISFFVSYTVTWSGGTSRRSIYWTGTNDYFQCLVEKGGVYPIYAGSSLTFSDLEVTVQYTKTTS